MPRESIKHRKQRAQIVVDRIDAYYPETSGFLNYNNPFELAIAVVLSAQTTDRAVNLVTPALFTRWPTPFSLADASVFEVEEVIHSLGFFHTKAQRVVACAQTLVIEFGGEVPQSASELMRLPGVGRKTANVILNTAFDIVEGIAVDTHVDRIAHNLGLSDAKSPTKTEEDLLNLIPQDQWKNVNHRWITFGRTICKAPRPRCEECFIADLCPQETPHCVKDVLTD